MKAAREFVSTTVIATILVIACLLIGGYLSSCRGARETTPNRSAEFPAIVPVPVEIDGWVVRVFESCAEAERWVAANPRAGAVC